MVKIPGLDDLKKMGADLMDSAKSVNLGGMVDKLKSGIESVSSKKDAGDVPQDSNELQNLFQELQKTLNEFSAAQATQTAAMKRMQNLLTDLARVTAAYAKPAAPSANPNEDEKK